MAYCVCPGWLWWWRIWWNEDWQGKPKFSEKTCPSGTLSTTNPTWPDPCANPGRRGGKPATNRLSYGAALEGTKYFEVSMRRLEKNFTVKYTAQLILPTLCKIHCCRLILNGNRPESLIRQGRRGISVDSRVYRVLLTDSLVCWDNCIHSLIILFIIHLFLDSI
jgi:hypothetical protein